MQSFIRGCWLNLSEFHQFSETVEVTVHWSTWSHFILLFTACDNRSPQIPGETDAEGMFLCFTVQLLTFFTVLFFFFFKGFLIVTLTCNNKVPVIVSIETWNRLSHCLSEAVNNLKAHERKGQVFRKVKKWHTKTQGNLAHVIFMNGLERILQTFASLFSCEIVSRSCLVTAQTVYVDSVPSRASTVGCTWLMLWTLNSGYHEAIWLFTQNECNAFSPIHTSSYYSMATAQR